MLAVPNSRAKLVALSLWCATTIPISNTVESHSTFPISRKYISDIYICSTSAAKLAYR